MRTPLIPVCSVQQTLRSWSPAASILLLTTLAVGCASPGPPRPPSLGLPALVKDLTAERRGNAVYLRWTTPDKTTDRLDIKGQLSAEICRISLPVSALPQACAPAVKLPVQSGPSHATDTLPAALTTGSPSLLEYTVQILNSHGRSAGPSIKAFAAAGAAPPAVENFHATPTPEGAMLEWQKQESYAVVELDRLPIGPDGVVIEPPQKKKSSKSSAKTSTPTKSPAVSKPFQLAPAAPIEVKLRTPAQSTDPGGTIDHTAQRGSTYRYTAQRVSLVSLAGHALELRSDSSSPVTILMRNTFPPHVPTGLEAVPGGATSADRSIDLSWTPNSDQNLAGYSVYRQEIDSKGIAAGTAARLNSIPVVGPAYRDQTAMAGHRYVYRVTAVDTAGNESAPSDPVQETLREQ
jgi:hypothetical protein